MQNVPSNLQAGEQFKPAVVRKINDILDYLKSQRIITDGKTIKANYGANGISLHCPLQKQGGSVQQSKPFNHPWKMTIITDENGYKKLKIQDARIQIDGGTPDRLYYQGFEIDLPQEEDTYYVIGYAVYDPDVADGSIGVEYTGGFFYLNSEATTSDITNIFGFHTFVIGTLIVEEAETGGSSSGEEFTYKIGEQYYTSVFNIYDDLASENFGVHIIAETYPQDGEVLTDFLGDTIIINAGQVFLDDTGINTQEYEEEISGTKLFCVQIDTSAKTAEITSFGLNEWVFQEDGIYNVPLAVLRQGVYGYNIQVFLYGAFHFRLGGKVLLNENDGAPGYLQEKLQYDVQLWDNLSQDQKQIYTNDKQYIKGITHDVNQSSSSAEGVNLYDQLYWDYSAITDWNKNKDYILNADNGELKWEDFKSKVSSTDQKGYLNSKFEDTEGVHWTFSNNKIHANFDGLGKVKVEASDVADYLAAKLTASKGDITLSIEIPQDSSSGESSSSVQPMSQVIDISLNVSGTGLLFYDNGSLSVVQHPQNNAVLAWINNEFIWIELADCETACNGSSSSSSSAGA